MIKVTYITNNALRALQKFNVRYVGYPGKYDVYIPSNPFTLNKIIVGSTVIETVTFAIYEDTLFISEEASFTLHSSVNAHIKRLYEAFQIAEDLNLIDPLNCRALKKLVKDIEKDFKELTE